MQALLQSGVSAGVPCRCSTSKQQSLKPRCELHTQRSFCSGRQLRQAASNGATCSAFFKLGGESSASAGVYGSQGGREEYTSDDVEQYFNYMGMLADEGTYDRMEAILEAGIAPVDILLLWAAQEGDTPKTAELLRAGADPAAKDLNGKTPAELTKDEEIKAMLQDLTLAQTFESE